MAIAAWRLVPALIILAVVGAATPGATDAAPIEIGADSAYPSAPGSRGRAPAEPPPERVVLDLGAVPPDRREALAAALPEWEEAIAAGSSEVTVARGDARRLKTAGFAVAARPAPVAPTAWPQCYRTLDQTYTWAAAYAKEHSDLVTLLDIGDSYCKGKGGCRTPAGDRIPGADILVAKVTAAPDSPGPTGRLWIDGGLHSRELPTTAVVSSFLEHVVAGYGTNAQITYLLDHRALYVGLASNPDGRQLVELGTRPPYGGAPWYWRKNGHQDRSPCQWPPVGGNHFGVDLNRNHAFKWTAPGHSTNPCDATFRGRSPASEPATAAYEAFVRGIFPDQRGPGDGDAAPRDTTGMLINFHNATNPGMVLVPWGWTTRRAPNDHDLTAIATRMIRDNGYDWRYALYPVSGNTRDWGYGELGIPAYVVELQGSDFFTPCPALPGVIAGQIAPLEMALDISEAPYRRINGPEATALDSTRQPGARAPVLAAHFSEQFAGLGVVAGAEVTVARVGGGPVAGYASPRDTPGAGLAMQPVDGAFDTWQEDATLDLAAADLPPGRYYAVVRGRDAKGFWGPGRAHFFDVDAVVPEVVVTKTAPAEVRAGEVLTYTLGMSVTRGAVSETRLADRLPSGVTFAAASDRGTLANGVVT
ncbi:MAG: M14 family zinc carboxypeptidase, partial [Anaerolineae bacterium]